MGNSCSRQKQKKKEKSDTSNPALHIIREAQRKYFNSHIESDIDDSDEDDEKEDSTEIDGLDGSESSLNNLEDELFETSNMDTSILGDSITIVETTVTGLGNGNAVNNNTIAGDDVSSVTTTTVLVKEEAEVPATEVTGKKGKSVVVKRRDKAKYIRLSKRGNFFSIFNTEDKKARSVDPKLYQYPFENIVFEGGGNKGLAYCGAVRLLEELNIWPQIKRLAGTSAGAMTAALLAVGYDSHDLEQFFSLNLNKIFLDHKFGYLSLLPNLLTSYGWNPGRRIYKWFGQKICEKTGDPDTTFRQVYDMYHRELCVVVTNLNQMTSLYCHPKTTPDMPVRLAVRMSMSIPGMFKAVKHTIHGQTDIFVDGGVLCNYPIHCFDGWWLSMKPEDNFLEKLQPLEDIPRLLERTERFGTYNEKTLGMQLYSDNEQDLLKYQLENLRHGVQLQELPNTKLAREKIRKKKLQLKTDREHRRLVNAMNSFLRALNKHNCDRNDTIDREELEAALKDETLFPRKRKLILFGDVDSDIILEYLDRDHDGKISYQELLSFMEDTGISMQNRFLGYQRRTIKNFPGFLDTLQATLLTNVKRVYVEERDLKRTVGINTGHVGTSDFVLETADIEFVLERGKRSLEAFLRYYVATNHLKKKPEYKRLNDNLRKDSKASIISSGSIQSFNSNNGLPLTIATTNPSSGNPSAPSPLATVAESNTGLGPDPTAKPFGLSPPPTPGHNPASRTRSGSSNKSVSISDRVEIMGNKSRYHSNSEDSVKEEEVDSDDDDEEEEVDCEEDGQENKLLLGDCLDGKNKSSSKNSNSSPAGRNHNTPSPQDESTRHNINGHSSLSPSHVGSPKDNRFFFKDSAKKQNGQAILQVDVVVHQSPEKIENPTTPLLQAIEAQDSLELHPLATHR